ncbi:hypothetical protein F7734_02655 [Scytonema sp. UIC 10036]|uniref:hypothetical protein n=1 Tax=Scytonema sp. UIC 10036 TaxID=2304196 RepID=UPI0012DA1BE7|nr:hypothetical protein [Scytonema sp. UIC 10036]MUG91443.1 hypothetical protein [Scytonema sp. UIC 10036]
MGEFIGQAVDRVDGRVKVTGTAKYTAEFSLPQLAHAVILQSTIAKGRIRKIDTQAAERLPGVLAVMTHLNAPKLNEIPEDLKPTQGKTGQRLIPLQGETIHYHGQHIGVVIAETLEQANYAATLVKVDCEEEALINNVVHLSENWCKHFPILSTVIATSVFEFTGSKQLRFYTKYFAWLCVFSDC